jgi:pilus assembly protein CpaD
MSLNTFEGDLRVRSGVAVRFRARFVMLSMLALGACATSHPVPPPVTPYDYRDRHPIVLSETPIVIDILPRSTGGDVDSETANRLKAFARKYEEVGHGPVMMSTPVSTRGGDKSLSGVNAAVLRGLETAGIRDVKVTEYPVPDPKLAAPIRLSFTGVRSKVADRCGLWPRDLASGTSVDGWQNETYWNFGCATQNMIATQVSAPGDLVSPRGSTPADIEMRMRGIGKLRQGADPASSWSGKAGSISGVGGN